jgi:hypothetical protein
VLKANAKALIGSALATSSRATYSSGFAKFLSFIEQYGDHDDSRNPFPVSEETAVDFTTWLYRFDDKAPNTIRTYIYAVKSAQIDFGYGPWPEFPLLERCLQGIRRLGTSSQAPLREPITLTHLQRLFDHCCSGSLGDLSLRAAFSCALFGLMRVSEVTHFKSSPDVPSLCRRDLSFQTLNDMDCAVLRLRRSKTDQFHHGVDIVLPHLDSPLCPHCALHALVSASASSSADAPLFVQASSGVVHSLLTRRTFTAILSSVLGGESALLKAHSFRIGGACLLEAAGVHHYIIQRLGRWASDSYKVYLRATLASEAQYRHRMFVAPSSSSLGVVSASSSALASLGFPVVAEAGSALAKTSAQSESTPGVPEKVSNGDERALTAIVKIL